MEKFFSSCTTLDELKKAYKAAAMRHHPDRGGDLETMKAINLEYEEAFDRLKKAQNAEAANDKSGKKRSTAEAPEDFIRIIEALLKLDGIEVELCGRWLWIAGDTKPHKEALKAAGCRWSREKGKWYWRPAEESGAYHRGGHSMSYIRRKYGSEIFTAAGTADREPLPVH